MIVAPVTSRKTDRTFPFEALLGPECGLSVPSKAMLNQLRTVDKKRVVATYGAAGPQTMASIDEALKIAVGLVPV